MKINKYLYLLTLFIVFTGCDAVKKEQIDFKKPEIQIPKPLPMPVSNKGSLYSMQGASLFADKKDLQIGDIIQVNISESLNSNSNNKREIKSDRNNSLGGGVFSSTGNNKLGGTVGSLTNSFNRGLGVDFNTQTSNSDKGEVKTQFTESFDTTISAIIQETYQNGNYYIKGSKELLIDGQKQEIMISGVIRPYDITSDNSINSSQIANLKVLYDKNGDEADALETPWGLKVLRYIWPF